MKTKYVLASGAFIAFLFILSAVFIPELGAGNARSTTESYVVESPHNYANNYDNTWTITKSGAEWIKVHFEKYDVERRYDYIYLYDANGVQKASYSSTNRYNVWSVEIPGDTVYVRLKTDSSVTRWGFKIDQIEFEAGAAPPPTEGEQVTDIFTGYVAGGEIDYFSVDAVAGRMDLSVSWGSSYDIDCYIMASANYASYLARGYTTANPETCSYTITSAGTYYIGVRMYTSTAPSSSYTATLTYWTEGGTPADTEAPVVSITSPANGATVSGTVAVAISATDNVAVTDTFLSINGGTYFAVGSTYNWATTGLADGNHNLRAKAVDAASNEGTSALITVEVDNIVEDTVAPVVTITSPANGADVEGTIDVFFTATDNVGVANTYLKIDDGSWFVASSGWDWDTTGYTDGTHTVQAGATDAATNEGFSAIVSVTVDNSVEPPPTEDGDVNYLGAVAGGEIDYYEIYAYEGAISVSVSWIGSADIDCYIMTSANYASYLARGYTTNNPETCAYNVPTGTSGTFYIGVRMYTATAAATDYDCHVTWAAEYVEPPPPPPITGDQFALIVGISDYDRISDLSYCDEDATDWYNYLISIGYSTNNIRILGDTHTTNYPTYYAIASEYNYKASLDWLASVAESGNRVAFITSGHGAGDGDGSSYLCAWDCADGIDGEDGDFYDTEIDDKLEAIAAKGAYVFFFVDHCYSGGLGPEAMAVAHSANIYVTTTCTEDGYGWDDGASQNGAWTACFVEDTLIDHFGSNPATTMEEAFAYASSIYSHTGGDAAMEFDGAASTFILQ